MARVLVVDDEEGIRRTTGFFLQGAGHQVQTAANVAEAREMLGEDAFDVVMSDIVMPGEDGLQLLAAVRECNPRIQVNLGGKDSGVSRGHVAAAVGITVGSAPFRSPLRSAIVSACYPSVVSRACRPVAHPRPAAGSGLQQFGARG